MKKGQPQKDTPVYSTEEMAERFIPVLENLKQLANTLNEANKGILEMYDAFMQLVNNEGLRVRAKMYGASENEIAKIEELAKIESINRPEAYAGIVEVRLTELIETKKQGK